MQLNELKPTPGSKPKAVRVGRGIGSTYGKTCGKGHKGQKARSGGYHKVGFEGGQMPLQRRMPKTGFHSKKKRFVAEITLRQLEQLQVEEVNLALLQQRNLVPAEATSVKLIRTGVLSRPVVLRGIKASEGAKAAVEAAGGRLEG